jgi:hypothetical protein
MYGLVCGCLPAFLWQKRAFISFEAQLGGTGVSGANISDLVI